MQKFLVGTGIRVFAIEAESPRLAIEALKERIRERRDAYPAIPQPVIVSEWSPAQVSSDISMSLADSLPDLNFVVFDAERTTILAGELAGEYQEPATRELARALPRIIPPALFYQLPADGRGGLPLMDDYYANFE